LLCPTQRATAPQAVGSYVCAWNINNRNASKFKSHCHNDEPIGIRARRVGGLQPPRLGQNHYFSGSSQKWKIYIFWFFKLKNIIHSA